MKLMYIVLTAAGILGMVATPTAAYQKLGDLMAEKGFEWIVDKWVLSPSSKGMSMIQYEWDLDKHIIHMRMERQHDDFKYCGMIMFNALQKKIIGMGADNKGGVGMVSWRMEDATLVQRYERTGSDGNDKSEVICTKVDSSTMKVDIYTIEEGDRRSSKPIATSIYKRESEKVSRSDSFQPPKDRDRKKN
jgi:hypothetical protein